jgi:hypothetical protein
VGFDNCYIPNLTELTKYYNEFGLEMLYKRFRKYDSWSGDSDAINFLESKIKEYEKVIDTDSGDNIVWM